MSKHEEFLEKVVQKIFSMPINSEPAGWNYVNCFAVAGLYAIGFDSSENLVVVSSSGQSIVDTSTGERLYRNRDQSGYNEKKLEAVPLDKPNRPPVRMTGLGGGGLRTLTDDGWKLSIVHKGWPRGRLILQEPNSSLFGNKFKDRDYCFGSHVLADKLEFRVFGFSETGSVLVWSDEVDVRIYRKKV